MIIHKFSLITLISIIIMLFLFAKSALVEGFSSVPNNDQFLIPDIRVYEDFEDTSTVKDNLVKSFWMFQIQESYPKIGSMTFNDDFTFIINLVLAKSFDMENNTMISDGICEYQGTYEIHGQQLTLHIEKRTVSLSKTFDSSEDNFDYENVEIIYGTISDSFDTIIFESLKYQLVCFRDI